MHLALRKMGGPDPATETGPTRCHLRHRARPSQVAEPQPLSRHPYQPACTNPCSTGLGPDVVGHWR